MTTPAPPAAVPAPADGLAAELRGYGPVGLAAVLVILLSGTAVVGRIAVPVGAVLALAWVRASRTPWRDIGYVRPRSWVSTIVAGVLLGVALKLVLKALVMPLLGADPVNQAYRYLTGNTALLPAAVWAMLVAGFAEETVFRGLLFERLRGVLGRGGRAMALIIVLTSLVFGAAHYAGQGWAGVQNATLVALVLGTVYARSGQIWTVVIAHAAFDLTALALIYWELEAAVARLLF